jgi:hypothetical protein
LILCSTASAQNEHGADPFSSGKIQARLDIREWNFKDGADTLGSYRFAPAFARTMNEANEVMTDPSGLFTRGHYQI